MDWAHSKSIEQQSVAFGPYFSDILFLTPALWLWKSRYKHVFAWINIIGQHKNVPGGVKEDADHAPSLQQDFEDVSL